MPLWLSKLRRGWPHNGCTPARLSTTQSAAPSVDDRVCLSALDRADVTDAEAVGTVQADP
jgi:hypothetical protein